MIVQFLTVLLCCLVIYSCKESPNTPLSDDQVNNLIDQPETEAVFYGPGDYYFGQLQNSAQEGGKYNTELVRFEIDSMDRVRGSFYFQPFGSDGMRGSFSGIIDRETQQLMCKRLFYAEGERYKEAIAYPLLEDAFGLGYTDTGGVAATLPAVEPNTFEIIFKTFKRQELEARINTTDRTRLKRLDFLLENGFNDSDLESTPFMEVMLNLDNEASSMEYLIYVMDPMLCGSGGCNLFVVNSKGETQSSITVSRPPIYVPVLSIEEQQSLNGQWKDLYVYSDGMRRLTYKNNHYTSNASMGERLEETDLSNFPESYLLVMDYLD